MDSSTFELLSKLLPAEIVLMIEEELIDLYRKKVVKNLSYITNCICMYDDRLLVDGVAWIFDDDYCGRCGEKKAGLYNCVHKYYYTDALVDSECKC
nr:hypothetical protein K-LCC10_0223 [Kaumoebavirus]